MHYHRTKASCIIICFNRMIDISNILYQDFIHKLEADCWSQLYSTYRLWQPIKYTVWHPMKYAVWQPITNSPHGLKVCFPAVSQKAWYNIQQRTTLFTNKHMCKLLIPIKSLIPSRSSQLFIGFAALSVCFHSLLQVCV